MKNKHKRFNAKQFLFIIIAIIFFTIGTGCAIIGLYANGWDLIRFIKDQRFILIVAVAVVLGMFFIYQYLSKKIRKEGGF